MAKILNERQCREITRLNKEFFPFARKGWMCEGSEYGDILCNIIFNNDTDEYFKSDYNGNILVDELTVTSTDEAKQMAIIQGRIAKVAR